MSWEEYQRLARAGIMRHRRLSDAIDSAARGEEKDAEPGPGPEKHLFNRETTL